MITKENKLEISKHLESANTFITEARTSCMEALKLLLQDGEKYEYKSMKPIIRDEEESVILEVVSVDAENVYLEDDSELNLYDLGTDDLNTVVVFLDDDKNEQ